MVLFPIFVHMSHIICECGHSPLSFLLYLTHSSSLFFSLSSLLLSSSSPSLFSLSLFLDTTGNSFLYFPFLLHLFLFCNRPSFPFFLLPSLPHLLPLPSLPAVHGGSPSGSIQQCLGHFLDSYNQSSVFVVMEGPDVRTANRFWEMVWDQGCEHIIMLTPLDSEEVRWE